MLLGEFLDFPVVRSTDFICGQGTKILQSSQRCQKNCCWGKSCRECPIKGNSITPCCCLVAKVCPTLLWQPHGL